MAKPELEFHAPAAPWFPPEGAPDGVSEQALAVDPDTGDRTVLQRYAPGVDGSAGTTITHEYWEEVVILDGQLTDVGLGETYVSGMYACRPPGMPHGPYRSDAGCLMVVTVRHPPGSAAPIA